MASVFISYRRKPSAMLANLIARELRGRAIEVYIDTERMDTAGEFPSRLAEAIRKHDVFVCLVGETTLESDWVRREVETAHRLSKPMIPVFQESYTPIEPRDLEEPYLRALLEHDGVLIFDIKNVYIDQSIEFLAQVIENTSAWIHESDTATAAPVDQSRIGINIQGLTGQKFGAYELRELIGVGGMGAVYRAHQPSLRRDVAIKILPPAVATEIEYAERFRREAQTAASLEHAHIVPIHDYGVEGGIYYVVMRLLTGGSLADRLEFAHEHDGQLPSLKETAEVLRQLALALDYAHSRGVIHRDIKASNVMFDHQGASFVVDFGIAKLVGSTTQLTGTGVTMGTPSYMAPEQWKGESITPATDQYALGVMTYHMVTGRMPFEGPTPYTLMHKHLNEAPTPPNVWRSNLPNGVKDVLEQAMAKISRDRFPSARAFADGFAAAVQDEVDDATHFFTQPLPKPELPEPVPVDMQRYQPIVDAPTVTPPPGDVQADEQTPVASEHPPDERRLSPTMIAGVAVGIIIIGVIVLFVVGSGLSPGGFLAQAASATPTETNTLEPSAIPTRTPAIPLLIAQRNLNARTGPGPQYPAVGTVEPDEALDITGISDDGNWYQVILRDGTVGWLTTANTLVDVSGNLLAIPIVEPPTETATASPTLTLTDVPTDTRTPTLTRTPTATRTPTPATPVVQAIRDILVRLGPGSEYPSLTTLETASQLDITGISEDGAWYQVLLPDGRAGWLASSAALVETAGNVAAVPVALAPTETPTHTPTITPTRTPTVTPSPTPIPSFTPTNTITPSFTPPPPSPTRTLPPPTVITQCPGALPSRLIAGQQGYVLDDDPLPVNVRSGPGTDFPRIGQIAIRSVFDVIEGPTCVDNFAWYRIMYSSGFEGWIAEGDDLYFVEPLISNTQEPGSDLAQGSRVLARTCAIILQDEFSNGITPHDWFVGTGDGSLIQVVDDFYEIQLERSGQTAESTSWGSLRHPLIEGRRDMSITAVIAADNFSLAGSRTGLWLRYQDENNFLAFMMSSTGAYRIARFQRDYADLVEWTPTDAIRREDNTVNTIRIDITGDRFDFYINGDFMESVSDATWLSGRIAFWGSSSVLPNTFRLDYLRVCEN